LKVSPGELGLPKLNKDNLIELLLAIKRVAKSQDRKPIKDGAGVLALEK
jgi:hypothetical protein